MDFSISIVIPVYNGGPQLAACLEAVARLDPPASECLVVDDGSTDRSAVVAQGHGVRVLSTGCRRGPAYARNLGARAARGDIILFLDADVLAGPDAIARVLARFAEDAERDAVIGSYDDQPSSPDFISQYRNLLHAYTHQRGRTETTLFWTGCGAVRRSVFMELGGFCEDHERPYLEDIEFGCRLREAGHKVWLDKGLQVTHLKRIGFWQLIKTDLLGRAIPWTLLILRFRQMPADLNLRWGQRFSVLLVSLLTGSAAFQIALLAANGPEPARLGYWSGLAAASTISVAALNAEFYRFLAGRRGWSFALCAFPFHCLYFLSSGVGFGVGVLLHPSLKLVSAISPALASRLGVLFEPD